MDIPELPAQLVWLVQKGTKEILEIRVREDTQWLAPRVILDHQVYNYIIYRFCYTIDKVPRVQKEDANQELRGRKVKEDFLVISAETVPTDQEEYKVSAIHQV